ncbi:MAG: alpha/beta hydrolase [Woeseiaceae bacterium]
MPKRYVVLFVGIYLSACSSFDVLNTVTASSHYEVIKDVPYGDQDRQFLDIYLPKEVLPEAPVFVFYYGGGWRDGAKGDYEFVASVLTEAGIVVVLPDYRLFPAVQFPVFVEDSAQAMQWVIDHRAEYGLQGGPLFIGGHSAGAHIAALLAYDVRYLGGDRSTLSGMVGLSGPYDFLPIESGYLLDVFPEAIRSDSQPIRFVDSFSPSTLLIHGDADETVNIGNSDRLAESLRAVGVRVATKRYEGVGHARVAAAMASPLSGLAPTAQDIREFILADEAAD